MLPAHRIQNLLHFSHPDQVDIVLELRSLVAEIAPHAAEVIRPKGLVYFHADRGGPVSAGICQILIQPDHVRLAFIHGAFLADPLHLLEGDRIAKRYIRIASFEQAPWDAIRDLIEKSSRFDPYQPGVGATPYSNRESWDQDENKS